jgi:parvulin-like peptidyl-prolyl isomerase
MIRFILALFLCSIAFISSAQPMMKDSVDISVLSAQDQAKIKSMRAKLNLTEQQDLLIPSIYLYYQGLIEEQKKIMSTVAEEPSVNEEERLKDLNMRSEFIKKLRDERDLNVELALTPEQKEIYLTQIKIAKPQVLHFGVHDRMNCPVCVSPSTAP